MGGCQICSKKALRKHLNGNNPFQRIVNVVYFGCQKNEAGAYIITNTLGLINLPQWLVLGETELSLLPWSYYSMDRLPYNEF